MDVAEDRRRWPRAVLGVAVLVALSGCGEAAAPAAPASPPVSSVGPASLRSGQPVPAPAGKPVLTVTGRISQHNHGQALVWDLASLNRLGVSEVTVYDPWAKKSLTLRGVWLADLLQVAQAAPSSTVSMTALDDYRVQLTAREIQAGGIMVATQTGDGKAIPVEDGGPTRVIFLDGVASGKNPDQWIWSLKTLAVT